MKFYVRGRKATGKDLIYEIGAHFTRESAELAAEEARNAGWLFVSVTTVPMERRKK
jgi:hypothetical protein